eukprot:TRINITY_DN23469_c0_g1_i1.p1 TRINITY_DN23469_c0_g1~~TRINITY_DN23469_c0_g1_i1.p1  ORF type:complete len:1292 (+),score=211.45 TRINITY_DN23469_c0_g1_i1:145-4020(+)
MPLPNAKLSPIQHTLDAASRPSTTGKAPQSARTVGTGRVGGELFCKSLPPMSAGAVALRDLKLEQSAPIFTAASVKHKLWSAPMPLSARVHSDTGGIAMGGDNGIAAKDLSAAPTVADSNALKRMHLPGLGASAPTTPRKPNWPQSLVAGTLSKATVPPTWSPKGWLETRQRLVDEGRLKEIPQLMQSVRASTKRALAEKQYEVEVFQGFSRVRKKTTTVDLRPILTPAEKVDWYGRHNLEVPREVTAAQQAGSSDVEPPMIIADRDAIDIYECLREKDETKHRSIYIVVEVTDFGLDRKMNLSSAWLNHAPQALQSLIACSDLSRFLEAAALQLRSGNNCVRDHLTAKTDPYVFVCSGVTIFRGRREDGYPFLSAPGQISVIVCAMPSQRPAVTASTNIATGERTEWYDKSDDSTALLERLSLIGFSALQGRERLEQKPVLILPAFGCSGGGLHPRDAVANSLKHFRMRFSSFFDSLFVACGTHEEDLARQIDVGINAQVYAALLTQDVGSFAAWHWNEFVVAMHCNSIDLMSIMLMYMKSRQPEEEENSSASPFASELQEVDDAPVPTQQKGRRPSMQDQVRALDILADAHVENMRHQTYEATSQEAEVQLAFQAALTMPAQMPGQQQRRRSLSPPTGRRGSITALQNQSRRASHQGPAGGGDRRASLAAAAVRRGSNSALAVTRASSVDAVDERMNPKQRLMDKADKQLLDADRRRRVSVTHTKAVDISSEATPGVHYVVSTLVAKRISSEKLLTQEEIERNLREEARQNLRRRTHAAAGGGSQPDSAGKPERPGKLFQAKTEGDWPSGLRSSGSSAQPTPKAANSKGTEPSPAMLLALGAVLSPQSTTTASTYDNARIMTADTSRLEDVDDACSSHGSSDENLRPYKLYITVGKVIGTRNLDLSGFRLYCQCEVKSLLEDSKRITVRTQSVNVHQTGHGEAAFNEVLTVDEWTAASTLDISLWSENHKNALKIEFRTRLRCDKFFPEGFDGALPVDANGKCKLHLRIIPQDPQEGMEVTQKHDLIAVDGGNNSLMNLGASEWQVRKRLGALASSFQNASKEYWSHPSCQRARCLGNPPPAAVRPSRLLPRTTIDDPAAQLALLVSVPKGSQKRQSDLPITIKESYSSECPSKASSKEATAPKSKIEKEPSPKSTSENGRDEGSPPMEQPEPELEGKLPEPTSPAALLSPKWRSGNQEEPLSEPDFHLGRQRSKNAARRVSRSIMEEAEEQTSFASERQVDTGKGFIGDIKQKAIRRKTVRPDGEDLKQLTCKKSLKDGGRYDLTSIN